MTINYSKQVLLKRGNTAVSSTYVGPLGEVTYDTDLHQIRVHDGERAGGWIVPGGPEYDLLVPLIGNAVTQQTQIDSLLANVADLVNQGNVDPGTGNETFWFNTEDGRLYIKQADVWVDSSPAELPNPSYVTGIMEDFAGNIIPAANVTYSLGTQEAQWKDLWVSNNTIYIGNTPITVSNGTLLVDGNPVSAADSVGPLTVPSIFPTTFTATVDSAHYYGEGSLTLSGDAWSFEVTFAISSGGIIETQITNNTPWPSNPGYTNDMEFRFVEADHGIPGYTFDLTLTDIQNPGPMMYTTNLAASFPPTLPSGIISSETIKITADSTSWLFTPNGTLTTPGDIQIGANSYLRFSDSSFQGTAFVGDATRLYGTVDTDVDITVRHRISAADVCYIADGDEFVADIEFNDDITIVQVGWTVDVDGTDYTVTSIDPSPPANQYRITAAGATFVQGTEYTFTDSNATLKTWRFNNDTATLVAPGGAILSSESQSIDEGVYYRDFSIELSTPDGTNEHRWTFDNIDGNLTLPMGGILGDTVSDGGLTLRSAEGKYSELGTFDGNTYIWVADAGYNGVSSESAAYIVTRYNTQSENRWIFNADGSTLFPGGRIKAPPEDSVGFSDNAGKNFVTVTDTQVIISVEDTTEYEWIFSQDGNLKLPGKLWARTSDDGSISFTNDGTTERGYLKVDAGYNMVVNAENNYYVKRNGSDRLAITDTTSEFKASTDVRIVSNIAGSNKTWSFESTGILTLPLNSYLETTDANLKVGSQGTVTIRSNAATLEGLKSWTFGTDGNLTIPGNITGTGTDVTITADTTNWTFYSNGNIGMPTGGNLVTSTGGLHSISLDLLKSIVASSATWGEFQANIAAL